MADLLLKARGNHCLMQDPWPTKNDYGLNQIMFQPFFLEPTNHFTVFLSVITTHRIGAGFLWSTVRRLLDAWSSRFPIR